MGYSKIPAIDFKHVTLFDNMIFVLNLKINPINYMALEINQNDSFIQINGELSSENASTLKQHFESFLNELDEIILNLDNVTFLEPSGAFTIEQLYLDFVKRNRIIQIIGRENKNITTTMKSTKTSYILSNDRI